MSTIAAGTTSGTALVSTGNTDGTLQLQVNGTTPSVTLATTGAIGVGSTPGYGTSGQVLTSGGSAAAPTWTTPSTGALVFISSQTVSTAVASVDFTTGINSTYDDYQIIFENVTASITDRFIQFFLYQSGAFSTGYSLIGTYANTGNVYASTETVNTSSIILSSPPNATTATRWRGNLLLQAVNSATSRVPSLMGTIGSTGNTAAQMGLQQLVAVSNTAAVVTGFRVAFNAGNVTAGTFRLYGIAKS